MDASLVYPGSLRKESLVYSLRMRQSDERHERVSNDVNTHQLLHS